MWSQFSDRTSPAFTLLCGLDSCEINVLDVWNEHEARLNDLQCWENLSEPFQHLLLDFVLLNPGLLTFSISFAVYLFGAPQIRCSLWMQRSSSSEEMVMMMMSCGPVSTGFEMQFNKMAATGCREVCLQQPVSEWRLFVGCPGVVWSILSLWLKSVWPFSSRPALHSSA